MTFSQEFSIAGRSIGGDAPVFFIAEAGVSHFGDMKLARDLLDLAISAGVDAFKLQVFDVESLISSSMQAWKERLRPRNLTLDEVFTIRGWCEDAKLPLILTAHDRSRIPWLSALNVPAIKVGSGERNNPDFLRDLAGLGKPMILSTGMARLVDVQESLMACAEGGCDQVALLHCVSAYPTPESEVNLRAMEALRSLFPGPVGYSDHTVDELAVLAAVSRGAQIVEKHITILRNIPDAQDWKVSAGPDNLANLVSNVRRIEFMLGHGRKEPGPAESDAMIWALKSLVASRDLPAGHRLIADDLVAKRPGNGIPPNFLKNVVGRRLSKQVGVDQQLELKDLL